MNFLQKFQAVFYKKFLTMDKVTSDPFQARSAPKIISVRTKPARVDPDTFNITQVGDFLELRLDWEKPPGYFIGYTLTVEYHDGKQVREQVTKISYDATDFLIEKPDHNFLMAGMAYKGTWLEKISKLSFKFKNTITFCTLYFDKPAKQAILYYYYILF